MISHAEFTKEIRKRKKYKEEEERRLRNCQVANQNVSLKLNNKKEKKKKKRMENQKREKDQQQNSVGSLFDTRHLIYLMLHSKTNFYIYACRLWVLNTADTCQPFIFLKYQYFLFLINCKSCMFPELYAIIRIVRTDLNLARSGLYPC
jgi:UDP-N-acetylenolpyruvoylglucosamine reductase